VGFVVINALVYYLFGMSYLGKVYKGIYENSQTVRSLGVRVDRLLYVLFAILFVLLGVAAWLVLAESNMRSSDAIFYLIKGIGVMILVGIAHKQYVFL
jgi:branched-subunit amino acid ABC-type transport system permease component